MMNTAAGLRVGFQDPAASLELPDMDSLERFAAGDVDAFEILFRRHQGDVYGWIVRLVRDAAAAEDLTVETFWRIYRSRKSFDAGREFLPWARRIATRVATDYLRSGKPSFVPVEMEIPSVDPDSAVRSELRQHIREAFTLLPARLRVAATLALIEELPYQEIAGALDISLSAVKMRVARATRLLRASLQRKGIKP